MHQRRESDSPPRQALVLVPKNHKQRWLPFVGGEVDIRKRFDIAVANSGGGGRLSLVLPGVDRLEALLLLLLQGSPLPCVDQPHPEREVAHIVLG